MPYRAYDRVELTNASSTEDGGYCSHSSLLFATWHRPFLALFEQVLYGHVQAVASKLSEPDKDKYVSEAKTFRLPFWDPFALDPSSNGPDDFIRSKAFSDKPPLVNANLTKYIISDKKPPVNPLYKFKFPADADNLDSDTGPLGPGATTLRTARDLEVLRNQIEPSGRSRLWTALNTVKTFNAYTTDVWTSGTRDYDSLEGTHNTVHAYVGQTMGSIQVSAFDPIFWLHHANIDRLFAIWQVMNPDSYLDETLQAHGVRSNHMLKARQLVNNQTALWPFRKSANDKDYWTSEAAKATTTLGYVYPETKDGALRKDVILKINKLYNTIGAKAAALQRSQMVAAAPPAVFAARKAQVPGQATAKLNNPDETEIPASTNQATLDVADEKFGMESQPEAQISTEAAEAAEAPEELQPSADIVVDNPAPLHEEPTPGESWANYQ
jgi:tyrosinase